MMKQITNKCRDVAQLVPDMSLVLVGPDMSLVLVGDSDTSFPCGLDVRPVVIFVACLPAEADDSVVVLTVEVTYNSQESQHHVKSYVPG